MSRNFELLQKLGKEQEILVSSPVEMTPASTETVAARQSVPAALAAPAVVPAVKADQEEISGLVQQLFLSAGADAPRSVVFTSTDSGAGCTWVCAQTAEMFASRIAGSVCVLDANLRRPAMAQQFEVENGPGLSDALVQLDPIRAFARPLALPNLFLITAGLSTEAAQPLLTSDRMRLRITELRSEFDFVLIDSSAMNLANEAIGLGSMADGVVMVLKANTSRKQGARQAIQELQGGKAKVLGAVLNQRKFPIPQVLYKLF
jgi:Mrp family chromosome partitioning ATPase